MNGGCVALARTADGALTRPAHAREETADMGDLIGDAEAALDDLGHPGTCPDGSPEAEGFGALVEQAGQLRLLSSGQARRATRRLVVAQGV